MKYEVWAGTYGRESLQRTFKDGADAGIFATESRRAFLSVSIIERREDGTVARTLRASTGGDWSRQGEDCSYCEHPEELHVLARGEINCTYGYGRDACQCQRDYGSTDYRQAR